MNGSAMKAERVRAGLTGEEVAARVGVSPTTVWSWEGGKREPGGANLLKLSELYGCTPDFLLGQTEDRLGTAIGRVVREEETCSTSES